VYEEFVGVLNDELMVLDVGGSQWIGRVRGVRDSQDESSGQTTRIHGTDFREDLANIVIFAQFNMIDRETGEVYSIVEGIPDPEAPWTGTGDLVGLAGIAGQLADTLRDDIEAMRSKIRADLAWLRARIIAEGGDPGDLTYAALAPADWRSYDPAGWILQTPTIGHLAPGPLIQWLCALAGFRCEFSTEAETRLALASDPDWMAARYNLFDLDWGMGIKVHAALTEVCERLGIQMTIRMDWTRTLFFTRIGEPDYPPFPIDPTLAISSEMGDDIQPDVDTGVWIVGDHDLYEFVDLPLIPDWNPVWTSIFWRGGMLELRDILEMHGLNYLTARLRDLPVEYQELDVEGNEFWWAGKSRNDMLCSEYLDQIVCRLYRIEGMEQVLTPEEFRGEVTVKQPPIVTPLVTDPGKPYQITATIYDPKIPNANPIQTFEMAEMDSGHRIFETTGHVLFDRPRFKFAPSAFTKEFAELEVSDVLDDEPTIRCVFKGPVYRKFFGQTEVVGTRQVSGLRKCFVLESTETVPDAEEYLLEGERSADLTAEDIAASYLDRARQVTSGSARFQGMAGHEPSGEVQRVNVRVDESGGIQEDITFQFDEPSPDYSSQVELRHQIALLHHTRRAERMRSDRRDQYLNRLWKEFEKQDPASARTGHEWLALMAMQAGGAVSANVVNAEKGTGDGTFVAGEPIIAERDSSSGLLKTVPWSEVEDKDRRLVGVVTNPTDGHLTVVTEGRFKARVVGPVSAGDRLGYDKTNLALKADPGGSVTAEEDQPSASAVRILVRMGGGAATGVLRLRFKNMDGDYLNCVTWDGTDEGTQTIKIAKPYLLRRTPFDGQTRNGVSYVYSDAITRQATKGEDTITETVVPVYVLDDELYGISAPAGGTGVAAAPDYLDLNLDGRAWAEVEE
jgi:hypothetical protein